MNVQSLNYVCCDVLGFREFVQNAIKARSLSAIHGTRARMRFSAQMARYCSLVLMLHAFAIWAQTSRTDEIQLYIESGIHHSARSLAFSADGRLLAASGLDRAIKIWDIGSGRELMTLPNNSMASFLAFFPAQPLLAWIIHEVSSQKRKDALKG